MRFTLLCLFSIATLIVSAQSNLISMAADTPEVDTWGLYTGTHTLKQAKDFEWDWEYEKAIWIYINLMPTEHRQDAIKRVKNLKSKVGDLENFINITFDTYSVYDPEITIEKGDHVTTDAAKLKMKRIWANDLIYAVTR